MVLILVLIVIVMLSLGAYSFTDLMLAHHEAAQLTGRQVQTRALVDSGVEVVRLFLTQTEAGATGRGRHVRQSRSLPRRDGRARRRSRTPAAASASSRPTSTMRATSAASRYGLEDESTRLNLNTLLIAEKTMPGAGRTLLMALPGMTEDVADAILDWLDADDEPRELGAEIDYYSGLSARPTRRRTARWRRSRSCCWCAASRRSSCSGPTSTATASSIRTK